MPEVIHGVVRDEDGRRVEAARVFFASGPVPLPDVAALTAADGTFQLTAPVPGRYSLMCVLDDGRSETRSIEVIRGGEALVEFEMPADR
jgi:hypothetical protein